MRVALMRRRGALRQGRWPEERRLRAGFAPVSRRRGGISAPGPLDRCDAARFAIKAMNFLGRIEAESMADDHSAAAVDGDMDLAAHEETYGSFVALTETTVVTLICLVLELVLWGLEGQGFVAFIGFILTAGAAAFGWMTGLAWRAVAPVLVLMGLACIVL
jgi:hypothetical protein